MNLRAAVRLLPDLLVVTLGVGALAQGVMATGVLRPATVVFTFAWIAALLVRRRVRWAPALVPLIVAAHGVALREWPNSSGLTMVALFVSAAMFGARMPVPRAAVAAPLWPAAIGVLMATTDYGEGGLWDVFYPGAFMLALLAGGIAIGRATTGRRTVHEWADEAQRQIELRQEAIVGEERARIAQDLRALIAAEIRGIRELAARTRGQIERGDVVAAERSLLEIEDAGRETLADLRHMLGLLRRDMTDETLQPQPGLGSIADVVERAAQRGLAVDVTVEGTPVALPAGIEVVLYRVVERTVERACDAAVREIAVRITHESAAVAVQARGRGLARLGGEDYLGIRERVLLYGGDLLVATGERADVVDVRLPVPRTAEGMPV